MKHQSDESLFSLFNLRLPYVIIYLTISIGIALQIGGANWDIIWHSTNNVDSFLSPPHTVLYSGVALVIIFALVGMIPYIRKKENALKEYNVLSKQDTIKKGSTFISFNFLNSLIMLPYAIKLIVVGTIIEMFSGMFDNWWHNSFGFDGLLSPPHLILTVGMMLSIYGTLLGIYKLRCSDYGGKNHLLDASFIISYAVTWMVSVNLVFMFSLPYSQGQYFDFNPHPLASVIMTTLLIPFISSMIFFSAAKTLKEVPFRFTFIAITFIIIHSTATIISNSYFIMIYPIYLLNILPAIIADLIMLYNRKSNENREKTVKQYLYRNKTTIVASVIISTFFMTMFFPWSVNTYKEYFGIDMNTLESIEIFNQLLYPVIIPIIIPISIIMSILGVYAIIHLFNRCNKELLVDK